MTALENLALMGLTLPEPPGAVSNYETWVQSGHLIMTSGQLPWRDGVMCHPGRLGAEVSIEQGNEAARIATLNGIASCSVRTVAPPARSRLRALNS